MAWFNDHRWVLSCEQENIKDIDRAIVSGVEFRTAASSARRYCTYPKHTRLNAVSSIIQSADIKLHFYIANLPYC